eukprot:GGOE01004062.1.p2 GENE.GGOE01004062.1~~GGOE01004062.1.p2  ORF type:complete len:234 (-),score=83.03 GGOE01004062.1:213-914(-)
MGGHDAINLQRLLRCCEAMVASPDGPPLDRAMLKFFLDDAQTLLAGLPDDALKIGFARRLQMLEPCIRSDPPHVQRTALLSRSPDPTIPPPTVEEAVQVVPPERGVRERRLRKRRQGANAEDDGDTVAGETDGANELKEEEVIDELASMVTLFRDKALSMGVALKQDVKAIEDTETLMQHSLGKLQAENKRLKTATASGWKQTIIFSILLALAVLLFIFMLFILALFSKKPRH